MIVQSGETSDCTGCVYQSLNWKNTKMAGWWWWKDRMNTMANGWRHQSAETCGHGSRGGELVLWSETNQKLSTLVSCLVCYTINNTILLVTSSVRVAVTVTIDTKMIMVTSKMKYSNVGDNEDFSKTAMVTTHREIRDDCALAILHSLPSNTWCSAVLSRFVVFVCPSHDLSISCLSLDSQLIAINLM